MYNLHDMGGTLKGEIGEIVFAHSHKYVHRTKGKSQDWLEKIPIIIPDEIKDFLKQHWNTFDAFKLVNEGETLKNIIFYEIKTTNDPNKKLVLTRNSRDFYEICRRKGFEVRSIYVYFLENWNIEIVEKDFDKSDYTIHSGNPLFSKAKFPVRHNRRTYNHTALILAK